MAEFFEILHYYLIRGKRKYITMILLIILFIILTIFDGFYIVGENESAMIKTFGNVVEVSDAGLHFKLPFLQSVKLINTTTQAMPIGYKYDKKTKKDLVVDSEGIMITSDFNFVNVDFYLEYKISNPIAYSYYIQNPEETLRNMVLSCIRDVIVNYTVDEIITTSKFKIQTEIKQRLIDIVNRINIGLSIVNLTMQDAVPPTEDILRAFKEVETSKQKADTLVNKAKKYQSEQIPLANAKVDKIINDATAIKESRISEALGQVSRFEKMYDEYKLNTVITRKRLIYETLEEILPNAKIYVTDGSTSNILPLEPVITTVR